MDPMRNADSRRYPQANVVPAALPPTVSSGENERAACINPARISTKRNRI
jgi:hypothetical protein